MNTANTTTDMAMAQETTATEKIELMAEQSRARIANFIEQEAYSLQRDIFRWFVINPALQSLYH